MLRSIGGLLGRVIQGLDGQLGSVSDFCFHDRRWAIQYLIADTGSWLGGRQVLIENRNLGVPQGGLPVFSLLSQRKGVERTASWFRQGKLVWPSRKPHLRRSQEMVGATVVGVGGPAGHVSDLIADDRYWRIRYLVADTDKQLNQKKILLATDWIRAINWSKRLVSVDLSLEAIATSPEYHPNCVLDRKVEIQLHAHYKRPAYWKVER